MSEPLLEVHRREALGKNANRRLRSTGEVPAVVYGAGQESVPIQVSARRMSDILKSASGENTIFQLQLHGTDQSRHAMIRDLQVDPIDGHLIHIDFQRIMMDQKVRVSVPVEILGEAVGVKTDGGLLDFVTRELEIECLPGSIPDSIECDVAELHIGQHVEAGQLELPAGVTLLEDEERVVVSVAQRRIEAEEEPEEEEVLIEAEQEEPEVIQRGKTEEETE